MREQEGHRAEQDDEDKESKEPLKATPPPGAGRGKGVTGFVAERDRYADQRPVLGPGTVVVLDIGQPEQLVQGEPGMRGALADPAVRDGVLALVQPGGRVQLAQLVVGLEGAVLGG